jgi:hypothetical protein
MAVSSDVARVVHTANGVATFFSYAPIDGATSANLKVYLFNPTTGVLTLQTLGTDYTFGGGGVTFTAAPPNGRRVILFRVVDLLQPDVYKTNAPFPAVVTEKRFDEVVKGLQQINDVVQNRSIILPLSDAGFSSNVLPAVENRKGRVLYFNAATGDPEAKSLVDVGAVTTFPAWADSFLFQSTAAAGLADIGAVAKAGDTMTGPLTLPGAPTATNHAATKQYVDTEVGARVAKAGDAMTGPLTLSGAPTAAMHAATKGYVDTEVGTRVAKAGDTMTGFLTLHADPTAAMHAVTKQYVDRAYSSTATVTAVTAVDFTGIPSWANLVIVHIVNMATTSHSLRVQIGDTGGFVTSGYSSYASNIATGVSTISSTTHFSTAGQEISATFFAIFEIKRQRLFNRWQFTSIGGYNSPGTMLGAGYLNTDLVLDRVRVFVAGGTMTGQCHVEWLR